ncbi:hypothetical protein [Streptomyces sp. NPDC088762]|uniref:hypothetical protein n=1 Tax=Streptomyces sp. NPDC088762 TaxID=3365891 RepID=UPI00380D5009
MRAFRMVAVTVAAVVGAAVLAGCGPSGPGSGSGPGGEGDAPRATSAPPAAPTASAAPTAPTASAAASKPPSAEETLLRVSRSGGFAGETHTLIVKGDGAWTRLDGKAQEEGSGRLKPEDLDALRAALEEADFARLPRLATSSPAIYDGFFYAFVHGGYEVAADQGSLSPALEKVLAPLPPFTN